MEYSMAVHLIKFSPVLCGMLITNIAGNGFWCKGLLTGQLRRKLFLRSCNKYGLSIFCLIQICGDKIMMAKGFLITSSKCSYSFKLIITFAFFCSVKEIKTCFLKSFGVIIMSEVFGGMLPRLSATITISWCRCWATILQIRMVQLENEKLSQNKISQWANWINTGFKKIFSHFVK